jgi:hypothetical protein
MPRRNAVALMRHARGPDERIPPFCDLHHIQQTADLGAISSPGEKPIATFSLAKGEWPTRIALFVQALAMGAVIAVVLTMLLLSVSAAATRLGWRTCRKGCFS